MKLTAFDGYLVMFQFLDEYWRRASMCSSFQQIEDLAQLLGDISPTTFSDGKPADQAAWKDWLECVQGVVSGAEELTLDNTFDCMMLFLLCTIMNLGSICP